MKHAVATFLCCMPFLNFACFGAESAKEFERFGIYGRSEPVAQTTTPQPTTLPLQVNPGDRIAFIGNTLFEREQDYGFVEALFQQRFPEHRLVFRTLAWSADEIDVQPRPANFASTEQHLTREKADIIFAAFGFNESFAGSDGLHSFKTRLAAYLENLKTRAYNGKSAPRIVLVSPIPNENVPNVPAAELNNERIRLYVEAMRAVAQAQQVGFADVFSPMLKAMAEAKAPLTSNGIHLEETGYSIFASALFQACFAEAPPQHKQALMQAVQEKNRQFFRRFRPLNTFYYTGERSGTFGYLDFLPAMRSFDIMVANRDQRIWDLAQGRAVSAGIDDSNVPEMPKPVMNRAVNAWKSAADEQKCFKLDPRFEINLFAGEEQFPELANPIQMRWDSRGRLWVSCSTTYPHVYPGREPCDRIVILEDTDLDGRADKLKVFADNLHLPLSFEFGDGGIYVSEQPYLTFLKDTDGDDRADLRQIVLSGFGTEDSHHSLHDFAWTPDGALFIRESIFHHSQIETPYGPVRIQNSGWFRFEPCTQRLTAFGSYPSTNPWGVTFDRWGQHVASHPIYAEAFHALNPPYPQQHSAPKGLNGYSGTCGQVFVDVPSFPRELQGVMLKNRYKPTNRVEILQWEEQEFGYDERYVGDLLFSTDLCFIPVDLRFGPRGDLYVCDWYNPVKGHAQYALRDERRDHTSGRIWRITAKNHALGEVPPLATATIPDLLELLKRPESTHREWARRELRGRDHAGVKSALDVWVAGLDRTSPEWRHHQLEALWVYRGIGAPHSELLRELLSCDKPQARAAAAQQLQHEDVHDRMTLLRLAAKDANAVVRMQAVIAASYVGSKEALDTVLEIARRPHEKHLSYAIICALNSELLQRHWLNKPEYAEVPRLIQSQMSADEFTEKQLSPSDRKFDQNNDLAQVRIECVPEQMRFSLTRFIVKTGQPVKLSFINADLNDHNLVIVKPDALDEVGLAANAMASDPRNANSDFVPAEKKHLIVQNTSMIGPNRKRRMQVLRFTAPAEPGIYPYVCTFPGHWVAMTGEMLVVKDLKDADALLASRKVPEFVKEWTLSDFKDELKQSGYGDSAKGMKVFVTAKCVSCHSFHGHGARIGPDVSCISEKFKGEMLLMQILDPSSTIDDKYRAVQVRTNDGRMMVGMLVKEDDETLHLRADPLKPDQLTVIAKKEISKRTLSKASPMPTGLLNNLNKDEILNLLRFLETGDFSPPSSLQRKE